jgi:hypothetical protein
MIEEATMTGVAKQKRRNARKKAAARNPNA